MLSPPVPAPPARPYAHRQPTPTLPPPAAAPGRANVPLRRVTPPSRPRFCSYNPRPLTPHPYLSLSFSFSLLPPIFSPLFFFISVVFENFFQSEVPMTHGCYAHDNICICFSLFLCFSNSFPSCSFSFYRPWGIFCYSVNSHDPRPLTTRSYLSLSFSFAISSFRRGSFSLWPFLVLFIPLTFKDFF